MNDLGTLKHETIGMLYKHSYEGTSRLKEAVAKPLYSLDLQLLAHSFKGTYTRPIPLNESKSYRLFSINNSAEKVILVLPQTPNDYSQPLILSDIELSENRLEELCKQVTVEIEIIKLGLPDPTEYGEYLRRVEKIRKDNIREQ